MTMSTGDLIKVLADYCPDTPVMVEARGSRFEIIGDWYEDDQLRLVTHPQPNKRPFESTEAAHLEGGHEFQWGDTFLYALETRHLFDRVIVVAAEYRHLRPLDDGSRSFDWQDAEETVVLVLDPAEKLHFA